MLEQEEKAMRSLPQSGVPFLQARHLSDGFSQGLQGAPVQGPGALAFWCTLFACPPRRRNCGQTTQVPFHRVLPDWEPVATLAPPSLLSWSCFVLSLVPLQGCLLWCLFLCSLKLLGGLEEEAPPFPLALHSF